MRLIKDLMSCWLVSTLRLLQSHHTRPSWWQGTTRRPSPCRTRCLLPSTPYASLACYLMWNGIKAGPYYSQTVIIAEFPLWHASVRTLLFPYQHKVRDILTAKVNTDMPSVTQRRHCIHKCCSNTKEIEILRTCMYLFFYIGIWDVSKHFGLLHQNFLKTDMLTG